MNTPQPITDDDSSSPFGVRPRADAHRHYRQQPGAGTDCSRPVATHHARERWFERTADRDVGLEHAWTEGITVTVPRKESCEARLYPPVGVILLRRECAIVTVLCADRTLVSHPGLVRCEECGQQTTYRRSADGCEWCGEDLLQSGAIRLARSTFSESIDP